MHSESPFIAGLILKIAERCNLRCSYCYMYEHIDKTYLQRPAVMSAEVFTILLSRIQTYLASRSAGSTFSLTFHGGEPLLVGLDRFRFFVEQAHSLLGSSLEGIRIQTNATLVTPDWASALRDLDVKVGVSVDGTEAAHDLRRRDHHGIGSYNRVVAGLNILRAAGLSPTALCVVDPTQAGLDVYSHLRSLGFTQIDFLLPDATHDSKPFLYPQGGTPVADYLIPIFDTWFSENDPEVQIRLFTNIIMSLFGGTSRSESIGNGLSGYLVVDTDGSLHSNDAFKTCAADLSDTRCSVTTNELVDVIRHNSLARQTLYTGVDRPAACRGCSVENVCGGGYLPHRYSAKRYFDNPSIWCRDLFATIRHIEQAITRDKMHAA